MRKLILIAVAFVATACTPAQLTTLRTLTGWSPTPVERREILAAPDVPIGTVEGEILPDGTIRPWTAPPGSRCPQWYGAARLAGWPAHEWDRIDYVMWRESRCQPDVYTDINDGAIFVNDQSYGLVQVNVKPGIGTRPFIGPLVDWDFTRLFDPQTNLWVGRRMYEHWRAHSWAGNCGWWGWSTKGSGWC